MNKQSKSVIIGLCIGIALSLLQTPFIDENCENTSNINFIDRFKTSRDLRSNELGTDDDYEPKIILESDFDGNIPKLDPKPNQKFVRPRYYSTELGIKQKLFVSIISSYNSVETFGVAINKTISSYIDSYVFFVKGVGTRTINANLPLVGFEEQRSLLDIFRVINYLKDNYISNYDYFFIINDHSYIHGKRLVDLVNKISVSQLVHMGALTDHPGSLFCSIGRCFLYILVFIII